LPYLLIAPAVVILAVLVIRFRRVIFPRSLSNRLPLAFLGVAAVSVGVMIFFLAIQIQNTLETQKGRDFLVQAELSGNRLAEQIDNQISRLEDMNSSYNISNQIFFAQKTLDAMSPERRTAFLQNQEEQWMNPDDAFLRRSLMFKPVSVELNSVAGNNLPVISQIIVTDQYGALAGAIGEEPEHYYFGDKEWWQTAWNSEPGNMLFVGRPYIAEDGETVLIDIVMPLPKFESASDVVVSEYQGVLRAKLKLSEFALLAETGLGENMELALLDKTNGKWLFSSEDSQKAGTAVPVDVQENIRQYPLNWGVDPDETGEDVIHSHAVLSSSPEQPYLDDLGLTIVLQQPARGATNMSDFVVPVFVGGVIALILAGIIGYFAARQISRPIISLSDTAVAMADGQLGQTAEESGATELKTLAHSFNRMTDQLQQILLGLEQQVASRTERLEIVASLGERLSSILNLDDLLTEVVDQIQNSFGYYHAHIYLLDDEEQNLVVAAGTGSAGAEMKAQGHSILLSAATSLVAQSARSGQIVRVDNVRQTPDWLPNPLLPDTYSEMAVPITLEDKVVGVLDVQQSRVAGLDQGDAALLRSLANQVAVAINNARLFEEVETALAETREAQRRFVEQAWDKDSVARRSPGRVQFSLGESTTLSDAILAKARKEALTQAEPSVVTISKNDESVSKEQLDEGEEFTTVTDPADMQHVLVAPIVFGETTIGNLQLHEVDPDRHWSEGELALINAVIDQVTQTAENLRLLDEMQERASREQLISQVSDKLRRAPDMEALMKLATSEISRVLNPARTFIKFDSNNDDESDDNGESIAMSDNGNADIELPQVEDGSVTVEE